VIAVGDLRGGRAHLSPAGDKTVERYRCNRFDRMASHHRYGPATHYGEGVIETRVPRDVYEEHFAEYEMRYLGTPPGTELAIPPGKLDLLSQFERIWLR
jgi:hypothetical protein